MGGWVESEKPDRSWGVWEFQGKVRSEGIKLIHPEGEGSKAESLFLGIAKKTAGQGSAPRRKSPPSGDKPHNGRIVPPFPFVVIPNINPAFTKFLPSLTGVFTYPCYHESVVGKENPQED